MTPATHSPVRFSEAVEQPTADEGRVIADLKTTLKSILDTTTQDYGHAVRSVHAKGHGIVRGTLAVAGDLAPEYAQGLFAEPAEYEAILRFSTAPGDLLDDAVSAPRGVGFRATRRLVRAAARRPGFAEDPIR